jgi:hypothetical protein
MTAEYPCVNEEQKVILAHEEWVMLELRLGRASIAKPMSETDDVATRIVPPAEIDLRLKNEKAARGA